MKINLITYAFFSFVLMLFSSFAQASTFNCAAVETKMDTVLIIQKTESTKSLRKGLKLKKGQKITFHKNYSITKEKGEIIGFEDDAIIVKDKKGKIQTVNLKELTSVSKSVNLWWILPFIFAIFLGIIKSMSSFVFIKKVIQTGMSLFFLLFIGLCMAALTAAFLLFYFVFQKSKGYNLEKRWKAEIGTVEG